MLRAVGGRPGLRRLLVSYFLAASLRCQASSVAGVTGKTSAQRLRGMNRVSAANQARSAGSYRTRPAFRRSTAFWCRSTSNSAFFSSSLRTTRTARLNNQRISRQAILSSTWSANHHRASLAGERAGQRHDRVSGRHRLAVALSPRLQPGYNRLRSLLLDPEEQAFQQDWTRSAEGFIAAFRKSAGDDIDNPRLVELVGELALSSERFRTLWARHDVRGLDGGTTTVHHPVVGELRLHRDKLPVGDVLLVLYYADQGSESDEKLRLLASMAQAAPASVEPLTRADRLPGC
jgi:hypothetical protein